MSVERTRDAMRLERLLPWAVLGVFCGIALWHSVRATMGEEWPYLYDALRDIGMAQSILDGRYPADPNLAGESLWFNPFTGAVTALASFVARVPAHVANVIFGPYINLLLPVGMFLLASAFFGRWTGAAAAGFLIYVNAMAREHNPYTVVLCNIATYSPWLFAPHLAQGLFYLGLLAYWKARKTLLWRWHLAAGAMLGVTFTCHTAPALILGSIFVTASLVELWTLRRSPERWKRMPLECVLLCVALATAFLISLPYTYSIFRDYGFHMQNRMPSHYTVYDLTLKQLPVMLKDCVSVSSFVALIGFVALVRAGRSVERRLVIGWLVIDLLFLAETYLAQLDPSGGHSPQIVPGHHFTILLSSAKALLGGYGAVVCCHIGRRLLNRIVGRSRNNPDFARTAVGMAACIVIFCVGYPAYRSWGETTRRPIERAFMFRDLIEARPPAYDWVMKNTTPDDVFLTEDDDQIALLVVGPAARKVVATMWIFTSPYVNCTKRRDNRAAMFDALAANDANRFYTLASEYGVGYIMVSAKLRERVEKSAVPGIRPAFASGPIFTYAIDKERVAASRAARAGSGTGGLS